MADVRELSGSEEGDDDGDVASSEVSAPPRVHDLASELLAAAEAPVPGSRGGAVLAMAEAADPMAPPRVVAAGGGCGGGRRIVLDGDAVALTDGVRPTHLLVRATGAGGAGVLLLVERGERGVEPWPRDGETAGEVRFRAVRLDADRVVSGVVVDPD